MVIYIDERNIVDIDVPNLWVPDTFRTCVRPCKPDASRCVSVWTGILKPVLRACLSLDGRA
ncbi:hypothetical protein BC938DRAFT_480231 [Jimgerdemannia flammicorona]|uniref:Uncharacterized protein n=1 Tax=Jimgerdemannia flammicorona TaxID=994334 RepID=A0A433QJ47_9FUNG|nr:hypothetical protein BC938DRAFT_480231 [Jimgerdemannia flammicorona]